MKLQEQISRIKEVMGYNSENETSLNETSNEMLLKLRRNINFDTLDYYIDLYKNTSFVPLEDVSKSVNQTLVRVVNDKLPKFEENTPSEDRVKVKRKLIDFLMGIYGDKLTSYFEKRKEEYDNRVENDNVRYVFYKHDAPLNSHKWRGFAETYYNFYDLVSQFGDWVKVDWDLVKEKLDKIEDSESHSPTFTGWRDAPPVSIAKSGDKGIQPGYNFSIVKSFRVH